MKYADKVIKSAAIDKHITQLLHRKHCVKMDCGMMTKDISGLGFALKDILLIDVKHCD